MKVELNFELDFPSISLAIPEGAIRVTQWLQVGDHQAVLQDYESGFGGDINIDKYFILEETNGKRKFLSVKRGDWIFDMDDGSHRVFKGPTTYPRVMVQKALKSVVDDLRE